MDAQDQRNVLSWFLLLLVVYQLASKVAYGDISGLLIAWLK